MKHARGRRPDAAAIAAANDDPAESRRAWTAPAIGALVGLILVTLAVYAPVRHFDFIQIDDPLMVSENPHLAGGLTWANIRWAFSTDQIGYASFWIPLVWLSYLVDIQLFGLSPGAMHVSNLVIHILNTLLLFGVLRATTGSVGRSAFVAALFAVHPLHVESVAWITERKDVLSTYFWMLTMAAYVGYVRRPDWRRYLLVHVCFVLGLLVKPMLVTLPGALLLFDVWPLRRVENGWPRLILEKAPMLALTVVTSLVTLAAQETGEVPLGLRLGNATISYVEYLWKTLWPTRLMVASGLRESIPTWAIVVALGILFAISALAIRLVRSRPYLFVGWFWYVGTLLPVIGLVQFSVTPMADRFTYVPLIGLFVMAAWGLPDLLARWRVSPAVVGVAAALVVLASAVAARAQTMHWRDNVTIFTHATEVTFGVDAYTAHMMVGATLRDQSRIDEAIRHFTEAVALRPESDEAHASLGLALMQAGRAGEAVRALREALRLNPANDAARRAMDRFSKG